MKIVLVGEQSDYTDLSNVVVEVLEELGIAIEIEYTNEKTYKEELGISKVPALCIEEDSIEFKDMIFEGQTPPKEEIHSMFLSIMGIDERKEWGGCGSGSCGPSDCGTCSTGC